MPHVYTVAMHPLDQLIVALDFPSQRDAMQMVDRLDGTVRWVKVGLELYLAEGRAVVDALRAHNLEVFLDLKLHDIPNTVASAVRIAGQTGASLLTVHAAGGPAMIAAAVDAAPASLRLLAVTVLTSMDETELHAVGVEGNPQEQVVRLGTMAMAAGVYGLVCSPAEITPLRSSAVQQYRLVVPGIRPSGYPADDQRRTATASDAIRSGADMIVVGRPVTRASDPAATARHLLDEIAAAKLNLDLVRCDHKQ
ncbi:MAG: orotidine-5'-phosphate decarboxylase [Janthinobacterium lividum]